MSELSFDGGVVYLHGRKHLTVTADGACRVIDGDTIVIGGQGMRLYGIDAPAMSGKARGAAHCAEEHALGIRAKERLEQLMIWGAANGALRFDILNAKDRHNRMLVRIYACGIDIGAQLIADGLAKVYGAGWPKPVFCSCPTRQALFDADAAVREEKAAIPRAQRKTMFAIPPSGSG